MLRPIFVLLVVCVAVTTVLANKRTCFCSYKLCDTSNKCRSYDAPDNVYSHWLHLRCSTSRSRCAHDCPRNVRTVLGQPQSHTSGREKVCQLFPYKTNNQGVRVEAIRKNSNCDSHRASTVVGQGVICCRRTCGCKLVTRKLIGSKYHASPLNVYVPQPHVPLYYYCPTPLTKHCQSDCSRQISRSNSLGSNYVNANVGQKVCSAMNKLVPPPGVVVSVDYNIADGHKHYYNVPGPRVCCGCMCRASYTYGGQNKVIPFPFPQPHSRRYFPCGSHVSQCKSLCRGIITSSLSKTPATTIQDTIGYKICAIHGQTANIPPGLVLYSEYNIGNGFTKDKMDDFCCLSIPGFIINYNC